MAVLTKNRDTREIAGDYFALTVKSGKTIFAGALVAIDTDGYALPAADAAGLRVIGRAEHQAEGGKSILIKRSVFLWDNLSTDLVTEAEIDTYCFVADDQTVRRTGGTNSIVAGLIRGVTSDGVYVDTTVNPDGATAGAAAGALAAEGTIAADLADGSSLIKAAAGVIADAAIADEGNVRLVAVPANAGAPGTKGDIAFDATSIYVCTAASTWKKADLAIDTWET